jgi:hypothetical protein
MVCFIRLPPPVVEAVGMGQLSEGRGAEERSLKTQTSAQTVCPGRNAGTVFFGCFRVVQPGCASLLGMYV